MIRLTASSPRSKLGARAALANRLRATSWSVTRALGLLGIASVSIWCASTDDPAAPPPDPPVTIPDSGTPDVAPDRSTPPASSCAGSFCRIDLPGVEAIALNGVWARSATDVWIVGSSGYAARWNGTAWNRITTGTKQTLFAVWGSDEGVVWATSSGRSFFDLSGATDAGAPAADAGFKGIVRAIGGSGSAFYAVGTVDESSPRKNPAAQQHLALRNRRHRRRRSRLGAGVTAMRVVRSGWLREAQRGLGRERAGPVVRR